MICKIGNRKVNSKMDILMNYFNMCDAFSEQNCLPCPFSPNATGSYDCHAWIKQHPEESRKILLQRAETLCPHCGKQNSMSPEYVVKDSYTGDVMYVCEHCKKERSINAQG